MVTEQFNPIAPGMLANPYEMYRTMREQSPIYWSPIMEAWILTRYEDADFVLTDPRFSADRSRGRNRFSEMMNAQEQEFGPFSRVQTMLSSDPPDHTRLRRLVSKAFTPRAVENLRPRIHEIVAQLLDGAEKQGAFDLVNELSYPLPVIVIAEMLGVPAEDRPSFKRWSTDVVQTLGGPFVPPEVFAKARESLEELAEYLRAFIADRRANPRDDLISWLVAAEDQGQILSEDEIFATTILLLIAGNETTTHLISNGMLALFRNPDEMARLRGDSSLMPSAVEELLRYTGPVHLTGRVPKEALEIGGQPIEEGHVVIALLAAANRDPSKYEDPERLDVARNPTDHLGLGDGIHFCLGAPLARAEAQIAIGTMLQRFPKLTCQDLDPEWGGTFIIRGAKTLPVTV
jgi:cytochrome P450